MWTIETSDEYDGRLKRFAKKRRPELAAVLDNLDTMFTGLNSGLSIAQLRSFGFVHVEPAGILAVDQSGGSGGTKLRQARLYTYPDEKRTVLELITLGEKDTQQEDIRYAKEYVESIRKMEGTSNGPEKTV